MAFMLGSPDGGHDDAAVSPAPLALRSSDTDTAGEADADGVEPGAAAAAGSLKEALAGVAAETPTAEPESPPAAPLDTVGADEADPGDTLIRRIERLMPVEDARQSAPSFAAYSAMPPLPALKSAIDETPAAPPNQHEPMDAPAEPTAIPAFDLSGEPGPRPSALEPGLVQPQPEEQAEPIESELAAPDAGVEASPAEPPAALGFLLSLPEVSSQPARSLEPPVEASPPAAATRTADAPHSAPQFHEEGSLPAHAGPAMAQAEEMQEPAVGAAEASHEPPTHDPDGTGQSSPESGDALPPHEGAPQSAQAQGMEPLANALDAAVRLAADASVAAEALENLKRLLEHKQHLQDRLPPAQPGPRSSPAALPAMAPAASDPRPVRVAPPPLKLQPESEAEEDEEAKRVALMTRRRPLPERRGLDVRGFLAGFALSWAFGVVLYLFLTAG